MLENVMVKLEVNSPVVRDALLDGCAWVIQSERRDREDSGERVFGFDLERCERRMALATALDEQLVAGYEVVDVPVEIADGVTRNLAEVIAVDFPRFRRHFDLPRVWWSRSSGIRRRRVVVGVGSRIRSV
jgi:hypothetical protein